jgi:hypothetical protein
VRRLQIGLCLLSALGTLLVTAPGAGAAPAAGTSAATRPALVKATGVPPVRSVAGSGIGGPATYADQDGACNSLANGDGDFCLWFSTNFVGSLADYFNSDTNLSNNTFLTPGLGLGEVVANNAESALNADTELSVVVFTGAGFSGTGGMVAPRGFGNFNPTFVNNVESFQFI